MQTFNLLFPVIIYGIAFLTGYVIKIKYKPNVSGGRYECIDGMRGFLGLGVFIHHAVLWHQYIQIGKWGGIKSNFYNHFGATSVAFFFMITSFLFVSKLIKSKEKGFNWRHFFLSRIYRLVPMYYFSVILIIIIISILFLNQHRLDDGIQEFIAAILKWGSVAILQTPESSSKFIFLINAGVDWSLCYEWFFYFSLPFIALFILKSKPQLKYTIFSIIFILTFFNVYGIQTLATYCFLGGSGAAILVSLTSLKRKLKDIYASMIILTSLFLIVRYNLSLKFYVLLVSLVFTLIASGNSFFGILKNSTLKFLGDISYSTYLLHGILLFAVFYLGIGIENTRGFTPVEYSLIIFSITPVVVLISFLGFKYIEKPFMDKSKKILNKPKSNREFILPAQGAPIETQLPSTGNF